MTKKPVFGKAVTEMMTEFSRRAKSDCNDTAHARRALKKHIRVHSGLNSYTTSQKLSSDLRTSNFEI